MFLGRCEQKDEGGLSGNFDVGFISGGFIVDRAFETHIELVAVVCCGFGVVEDGLVGDVDVEDDTHDVGGFTGAYSEGDEEREDKSHNIGRIVNFTDVDGRFHRRWHDQVFGLEQVFTVNVTKFELRRF